MYWVILIVAFSHIATVSTACAETTPLSFAETIDRTKAATLAILQTTPSKFSPRPTTQFSIRGTGIHLKDGYMVTAGHAVKRQEGSKRVLPDEIHVLTQDFMEIPASFIGFNEFLDIAVYRFKPHELLPQLPVTGFAPEGVRPGDKVFTIGYPLGWGPAMGFGTIGNPDTFLPTVHTRLYQADLSTCRGNSGGGLFNHQGEIIGIVHAIIQTETTESDRRCSRFAFAVPGSLVQKTVTSLIEGKKLRFSALGIQLTTLRKTLQWKVVVAKATGPAKAGGAQQGDVILSIDNHPIHTAAELKNYLIEHTEPGQKIALKVQRGQKQRQLLITLGGH